jgi:hypothetical protein
MQDTYPWRGGPRRARGLRSDRSQSTSGGPLAPSPRNGQPLACRICWSDVVDEEGGELVTPCDCSGTMVRRAKATYPEIQKPIRSVHLSLDSSQMTSNPFIIFMHTQRYIHTSCLTQWQVQLRQVKGLTASRRCDICKKPWKAEYRDLAPNFAPTWKESIVSRFLAAQPYILTAFRWWRMVALAQGVLSALEAGAMGLRLGLRYRHQNNNPFRRYRAETRYVESLAHWAPFSFWAASAIPPVQLPLFLTMYLAASSSRALQGVIFGAAGMYAGALSGFAHGAIHTVLQTLHFFGGVTGVIAQGTGMMFQNLFRVLGSVLGH